MWPKLICTSCSPGPHVSCERMTPPLPLYSSPRPHASSNKRSKWDLMDWIGSLPSYSLPMSSIPVKDPPAEYQKNLILPAYASSFLLFPRLLTTRTWTGVMWRGRCRSRSPDGGDSTNLEPRFAITGSHLAQTRTGQTKTSNLSDSTTDILM